MKWLMLLGSSELEEGSPTPYEIVYLAPLVSANSEGLLALFGAADGRH